MTKRTLIQLIKEFWFKTLLSIIWGIYKVYIELPNENTISTFITNFSGSLFLLSWLHGQVIRVKKQQKLDDELGNVNIGLKGLLNKIEKQTKDLIGYSTGGDSLAYFKTSIRAPLTFCLDLYNVSEYPVFDFAGEWIDLDEPIDVDNGRLWTRNNFLIGDIHSNKVMMGCLQFDFTLRKQLRINIFSQTRNRNIIQQFRVIKVENTFIIAYQTTSENFKESVIPKEFPGYDPNDPEKIFK